MAANRSRSSSLPGCQHRGVLLGARLPRCISSVASPPSSGSCSGLRPAALGAELEDAVGVVPVVLQRFALVGEHRRAGRPPCAAAAWSCVAEDVARGPAHLAPSACSVSTSTAVWMVMCSEPVMRAPLSGWLARVFLADRHQAGHLGLGDPDSLRPQSASDRSAMAYWSECKGLRTAFMVSSGIDGTRATRPVGICSNSPTGRGRAGERRCSEGFRAWGPRAATLLGTMRSASPRRATRCARGPRQPRPAASTSPTAPRWMRRWTRSSASSGRSRSSSTTPASSAARPSSIPAAADWGRAHAHQPRRRLPRRTGGGAAHVASGRGRIIINICSVMSELGRPGIVPYTASKGAVKMLTKGMAVDLGPRASPSTASARAISRPS